MAEQPTTFPRRDGAGRVVSLAEFAMAGLGSTVVALIALTAIDALFALIGIGGFGRASGWLALILPVAWLYFPEVRAWPGYGLRFLVAVVAGVVALTAGVLAASALTGAVPLVAGGVGAVVAALLYAPIWFFGIKAVSERR